MKKGFIALFSVILIGALALALAIALAGRSINAERAVLEYQNGELARGVALACAEIAIQEVTADLNYSGNEDIMVNNNICHINTLGGSGNTNRSISVSATVGEYTKRFAITLATVLTVANKPQISSWQEVSAF